MARPESPTSPSEQPKIPHVIINPDVLDENVPYSIQLDREGCAAFLEAHGMNPRKISSQTIELRRRLPMNNLLGRFKKKKIILACDSIWEVSQGEGSRHDYQPNSVFQHEAKHAIDESRLHTRITDLIARSFMFRLGIITMPLLVGFTENSILADAVLSVLAESAGVATSAVAIVKYKHKSPWEKRAFGFVDKIKDDSKWHNLFTLTPKQ